ncbi:MAG TPA: GNAT family N-acetyltransferase, partial [Gammaproteobacteria bacterium]|nr:GNAT family N-acetyltransferase [Gammaproteobacteria bacterium]
AIEPVEHDSLHFETCYYPAIEYCIETGIDCYEAGAQGQHKLSRGFMPSTTHSVHWLANPQFSDAVADFLDEERREVAGYDSLLRDHAPFRSEP